MPIGLINAQEIRYITVSAPNEQQQAPVSSEKTSSKVIKESGLTRDSLKKSDQKNYKTTYLKNGLGDNWFVSAGAGFGVLMSEETRYVDYSVVARPTFALAFGKWLNPAWGLRVSATAAQLQGFSLWWEEEKDALGNVTKAAYGYGDWWTGTADHYKDYPIGRPPTNAYLDASIGKVSNESGTNKQQGIDVGEFIQNTYLRGERMSSKGHGRDYSMKYFSVGFDFMANLNNLFGYYNPKGFFNLIGYGGLGYVQTLAYGEVPRLDNIYEKFGLQANFRLNDAWSFDLEPQLLLLPEVFDRRVGDGNTLDLVANLVAGFTYRFGESHFYQPVCNSQQTTIINNVVNETRENCCDELKERLKKIEELLENKQPQQKIDKEHLRVVVHFVIDKHEVRPSEMYKLDEVARFMAKYPQVRVSVSGYADVKTAYPSYNMKLSERRVNEVVRILGSKYGVDKSRLKLGHFGDTVQPFDVNELNRAVIAFDIPEE